MSLVAIQWTLGNGRGALISIIGLLFVSVVCGGCSTPFHQQAKADQCEPGYAAATSNDPGMHGASMTLCIAGPDYCKTTSDCRPDYACEKDGGTFIPQGTGVCMPDTTAVLRRIQ